MAVRDVLRRRDARSAAHVPARHHASRRPLIVLYCSRTSATSRRSAQRRRGDSDHVAADAVGAVLGPRRGEAIVGALILVSIFSATNGLMLTTPRMYYAMARDGVFFKRLGDRDPRFGTPAFAIIATRCWAAVLAATGTFEQLLTYVGVHRLDLLWARRAERVRVPPARSRSAASVPRARAIRSTPLLFVRRPRCSCSTRS